MSIDMSKLSPAPWECSGWRVCAFPSGDIQVICDTANNKATRNANNAANAAFMALARNAFDVMMRRGWRPYRSRNGNWHIAKSLRCVWTNRKFEAWVDAHGFADPFEGLVEADRWYRENVEALK